jgi:Ca-activated chloride channel family protein
VTLRIEGACSGQPCSFGVGFDPGAASTRHDYIPRAWASRRIAALLDEIRQAGAEGATPLANSRMKELTEEIVRLSTRFGILTEYTAFLAKEDTRFRAADMDGLRAGVELQVRERVEKGRTGAAAVNQEANMKQLARAGRGGGGKDATTAPAASAPGRQAWFDEKMNTVTIDNVRQVGDRALYQRHNRWVDARILDREAEAPDRTVEFGTEAYMALAEQLRTENRLALLVQGGDVLLLVGKERVLVHQP